ncbi:hypothetical protein ASE75_03170 [Sphingomonas sp. Leaf17]|uniref:hypothetical protein n=1 Tax=Sphingomonas sp. Leaf17 TaxID=1735683 RepID=UPI0006F3EBCE|nr:hypothetical protein [Sphingomonas sp. Leaf17]KQM67892.1 hypothetical protein ASE75_03170 [Sphingomonas sp. Leaf17]
MLTVRHIGLFAGLLALAGCGSADPAVETPDTLQRELADTNVAGGDPAVAAALQAPLMSDPTLSQSANADTIRPPSQPDPDSVPADDPAPAATAADPAVASAPSPAACPDCAAVRRALTPVALAATQGPAIAACAARMRYSADWANRLPAGIALYPAAHVAEAAGTDEGGCRLRVARFISSAPVARLVDWYHATAGNGGWSPTHRADGDLHAVTGQRRGAVFTAYVTPRAGGGSDVALIASGG